MDYPLLRSILRKAEVLVKPAIFSLVVAPAYTRTFPANSETEGYVIEPQISFVYGSKTGF